MTGATPPLRTLGHEATAYASHGIKVFPLWHAVDGVCACRHGTECNRAAKHPRVRNGLTEATSDIPQIELWWSMWPHANIGMPAHPNGLAVLDVDPAHGGNDSLSVLTQWCSAKHGIDIMATRAVRTGSGGLHLYFAAPAGGIKTGARTLGAPGLDTRGAGGYVVAPPSVHACGGVYEVIADQHGLQPWPHVLTEIIEYKALPPRSEGAPSAHARPAAASNAERWARTALDRECAKLRGMTRENSGRNRALYVAAFKIGQRITFGIGEGEAADALLAAASGWRGHPAHSLRATIASGMRGGMTKPHAGPVRGPA